MKKLIALLIVLSLTLSSCTLLPEGFPGKDFLETLFDTSGNDPVENPPSDSDDTGNENTGNQGNAGGNNENHGNVGENPGNTDNCDKNHTDKDDDGKCDYCSVSVIVVVDVFALNDLHGKIVATSSQTGVGSLTTYLKNESDDNSILLSSGDMWQGTAESGLTFGTMMTDWMNRVGFVSMTVGNHEYDWSKEYVRSNYEIAEFPFLAINVYDTSTGKRAEYATPSVVVERDGVEIGIIGAIGDCYSSISSEMRDGFTFKTGSELTKLVKAEAQRLRAEGVDFIIYSIHDGYGSYSSGIKNVSNSDISSYYDASLSDGYVDLVFEGHTHQSYILKDSYGVYHLQGGGENSGLSRAEVKINSANGNTSVESPTIVKSSAWKNLSVHPIVTELLNDYSEVIAKATEKLGYNRSYRDDSDLEQLIAELYYEFGVEEWGDEYTITLGGGFLRTRSPYNLKAGDVYYADVYSLFTFNNDIVLCSISGKDLLSKFINTTNADYYVAAGVSIETLKNSIDQNKTYYIIVDSYTSGYRYNNLTEVARISGLYARDLFAEYVKSGGLAS